MKINILLIPLLFFSFLGCAKDYKIEQNELPAAKVGVQYNESIHIMSGKLIDKNFELKTDLPENIGIEVQPDNDVDGCNIIRVKGIPKYKGTYNINISTGFMVVGAVKLIKHITLKF